MPLPVNKVDSTDAEQTKSLQAKLLTLLQATEARIHCQTVMWDTISSVVDESVLKQRQPGQYLIFALRLAKY